MATITDNLPEVALTIEATPGLMWEHNDDLCDCTFQRIGFWTNPYIGSTLRVRLCCMWKKLDEMFPGMVTEIPAFYNYNEGQYETGARVWDSTEADMPRSIWYRHLAALTGRSLQEIRVDYQDADPPKAVRG